MRHILREVLRARQQAGDKLGRGGEKHNASDKIPRTRTGEEHMRNGLRYRLARQSVVVRPRKGCLQSSIGKNFIGEGAIKVIGLIEVFGIVTVEIDGKLRLHPRRHDEEGTAHQSGGSQLERDHGLYGRAMVFSRDGFWWKREDLPHLPYFYISHVIHGVCVPNGPSESQRSMEGKTEYISRDDDNIRAYGVISWDRGIHVKIDIASMNSMFESELRGAELRIVRSILIVPVLSAQL
jgi:hypothetical protein